MTELLKIQDFDQMYAIMEASFPDDEYRGYEGQNNYLRIQNIRCLYIEMKKQKK